MQPQPLIAVQDVGRVVAGISGCLDARTACSRSAAQVTREHGGRWNTKTKEWMDPGQPPMESAGTCEQTMLCGARFLRQECAGTMMGTMVTGIVVIGYDNHSKKYISTWMDSMGTGIFFMEGTAAPMARPLRRKAATTIPWKAQSRCVP
jgi:hypothetical protein